MVPLSILDLAPVPEGSDVSTALANTLDLARAADRLGFHRYWLAEHHNMIGIASAATSVVIGAVAAATQRIRVGAGGIMLPNHAPLVIAEQFGTLNALYPGRIDLGLGRAPGSDMATARALRRVHAGDADTFPQDVMELVSWFAPAEANQRIVANPGAGQDVPIWILGSSTFGAQLAAHLGLPYAFASHFAPQEMAGAARIYRETFRPSERLAKPHLMMACNVVCAPTDQVAADLATSQAQAFVNLRSGRPGKLPPPRPGYVEALDGAGRAMLGSVLACSIAGTPETVGPWIEAFAATTGADELILSSQIWDPAHRIRSIELIAGLM